MLKISPSVLAADFANLAQEAKAVKDGGADMLHLDVMDGHFVPNISFGMPVIASIRKATDLFLDVHIMISDPQRYAEDLVKAGADLITFHVEAEGDPANTISKIKSLGCKVGISLSPATPVEEVLPYVGQVDLVLVMTVVPGFGGQKFREDMCPKMKAIADEAKRLGHKDLLIQVDGGIDPGTAPVCAAHGANCFVAGSSIFGKADYKAAMDAIRSACN
ncbi:MAG: ribulose-phosphate 3-epimerase [Angelakisella sp.]|nr:ribulose-phosphate 3-epimerase [Angelakisella sp.]